MPTMRETLLEAARLLENAHDYHVQPQHRPAAAALRTLATRMDELLSSRKPCVCWQNGMEPGRHYDSCLLARLGEPVES